MTEVDVTNDAGKYYYDFNTTGFVDDTYEVRVDCPSGNNSPQIGEIKVGGYVDNIDASISSISSIVTDTRRIVKNKMTIDETNSKLQLWDDVGTVILYEWPLTDKDSGSIVLQGTGPANRGVPV